MNSNSAAVVVDASIELPPERIQALDIFVVPRLAESGRQRIELNHDLTAVSLLNQTSKPKQYSLPSPSLEAFKQTYQKALHQAGRVFAFHLIPGQDKATRQARLACNLLWPADIHLIEISTPGLGFAKIVEVVATLVQEGWDMVRYHTSLIELMLDRIHTLTIAPANALPKDRLIGELPSMSWINSWLRPNYVLSELDKVSGDYIFRTADVDLSLLGTALHDLIAQREQRRSPLKVSWRQPPFLKQSSDFQKALLIQAQSVEEVAGWSPFLYDQLGARFLEICLAPTRDNLLKAARQNKRAIDAAIRYEESSENRTMRLSDYRVYLK
jgi:hypothetical protein